MTAAELYNKFVKNGRRETEHVYTYKTSLQSVRNMLYRLRKQKAETFQVTTHDLTLTLHDWPEA